MENFVYYNPVKVIFGVGSLNNIGVEAAIYGKKVMLVSYENPTFFENTINRIHNSLKENNVEYIDYFGVTANPLLSQAKKGVEICKENAMELVIGLGGGSVMDCAKIIAAGVVYPYDIEQMIMFSHSDITSIPPNDSLPTVMIPTLPATGSEMNPTAVITDDKTMKKSYVWEPSCLYPKAAIMDPELTVSLPPYQTACGAFDIIAHVIEAYLNGRPDMNLTLQEHMQEGVVKAVMETLPVVWENPDDIQARGVLMWAASIALNGRLTSGTFGFTPMHQMGHVLSAQFGATHGATLACMMPAWMRYFVNRTDNGKYVQLTERIFGCDLSTAANQHEEMMRSYGVQTRISQFGVKECDIERLTDMVVAVSFGHDGKLVGNPQMERNDIWEIYKSAF